MRLDDLLRSHREEILAGWRSRIIESYPAQSSGFLAKPRGASGNPIGHAVAADTEAVLDGLLTGVGREEMAGRIDGIVRMRAVQEFTPSGALAFVFQLKGVVREILADHCDLAEPGLATEILELEARVDEAALVAFEKYVACREQVYQLKAKQMRDRSYKLMERAGLLWAEEGAGQESRKRGDLR